DYLVGERLLTIRSDPNNLTLAQVEIAHEILIERWDRLRTWLSQDPGSRALQQGFQDDADKWFKGSGTIGPRSRGNRPSAAKASLYFTWLAGADLTPAPAPAEFPHQLRPPLPQRT